MKRWLWLVLVFPVAFAVAADWSFEYRVAKLQYAVYGGGLGDTVRPSAKDAKIAFELTGRAAKEMFDAMGPDRVDRCGAQPGERFRSRDDDRVICTRGAQGDYRCSFGFDLVTGRSVGGAIC